MGVERESVFGGMLALGSMLLYLRFTRRKSWADYTAGLVVFAIALQAKATVCVVPEILLVLLLITPSVDRRRSIVGLWPWCLIVLPLMIVTRHAQADAALLTWSPPWARPLEALDAIAFYLGKLIWPVNLAVDYRRTPRWMIDHPSTRVLWPLPFVLTIAAIEWRKRWPWGLAGLAIFVSALAPVLGFAPFDFQGFSTVADRYVYLPTLGIAVIVTAAVRRVEPTRGGVVAMAILALLSIVGFVQTGVWASSSTLFQHRVDVHPSSGFGWQGLAGAYRHLGDLPHFRQALAAMSQEAARRVLLKDPDSPLALRRLQNTGPTTMQ